MRGVLIDPRAKTVTEVEADDWNDTESIYETIQCRTFEVMSRAGGLAVRDALYVDEEAMILRPSDPTFSFKGVGRLVGLGLIVGHTKDGDCASARTSLHALKKLVLF